MKKKLFFVLFFATLLFCIFTIFASAATYSGECGATNADNVTWTLDTTTGALEISGTGAMSDFSYSPAKAWLAHKSSIRSVTIGEGVTSIGYLAFYNCDSLASITISESVTSIGGRAFEDCDSLTSINIPASVTSIGGSAFEYCSSLTSVTFAEGSQYASFGSYMFQGCRSLASITLPDGVTSIDRYMFYNCSGLTSITIPSSVTSIDYNFHYCYKLVQITNLSRVTITNSMFPFNYLPVEIRTSRSTPFTNALATDTNGYIIYTVRNAKYFIGYTGTSSTLDLSGKDITAIYEYALYQRDDITSITIPSSVTSIGDSAFDDCDGLTSITIPSSVTSIGDSAFARCDSLTSVTFAEGSQCASIGSYVFKDCTGLTSITIPAGVTNIGSVAFENCTAIDVVYLNSVSLLNNFSAFEHLGKLLMYCDTVAINPASVVPDLISTTFPYTESISYLGTDYVAYSVHEHTWVDATTYIQHVQDGFRGEQCSVCSLMKGNDASAHEYGAWQKHNATQHKRVCACTEVEYADHAWNDGVITTQPTHTTLGEKAFTCSVCSETKTEDVAKTTTHSYGAWQKHNATQHKRVCACTEVEYTDHAWNNGVITKKPTDTEVGAKTFTCAVCSETKTEDVAKTTTHSYGAWQKHDATQHKGICACGDVKYVAHDWNNGVITIQATCVEFGEKTYTCSVCNETKTESIPKPTVHSYCAWQKHDAAQHKHACLSCSVTEYEDHSWNIGVITKKPTDTEVGVKTFTCIDCGESKTEEVAKKVTNTTPASNDSTNTSNKDDSTNTKDESLGAGAVIGIVGGSFAVAGGGGFALYWFVFRKRKIK